MSLSSFRWLIKRRETFHVTSFVDSLSLSLFYSLKLIRGTLDQHAQLARITWVQPRVLDKRQIQALQNRLDEWCKRVQETAEFVKNQTPDLFITV